MNSPILAPVVALVAWTLVVLGWAVVTRLPAMKAAGIDLATVRGGKPGGLDGVVSDAAQWKMHNYIHLVEQPVLFYAICIVLALVGAGGGIAVLLAWSYVGLRVVHSLIQGTSNIIRYRFAVFALGTLALTALTVIAAIAVLSD